MLKELSMSFSLTVDDQTCRKVNISITSHWVLASGVSVDTPINFQDEFGMWYIQDIYLPLENYI